MNLISGPDSPSGFTLGANLPWLHYGIDFGANAWRPQGGVAQTDQQRELDAAFAGLAEAGVRHVRWFLLCDGRAGIEFTERGRPTGLDAFVFRDLDIALEIAGRYRLQLMPVLLDFLWAAPARMLRGVQMGGRANVLLDPGSRQALLGTVFQPLLQRYGGSHEIFAWEIINEPEWITSVPVDEMRVFLAEAIALAHATTRQPITVGSAGMRWRDLYKGLHLDFYQVHWYDKLKRQPPLHTPLEALGFDRPVILGEFPTRGSRLSSTDIIEIARSAGYAGAFFWSLLSNDDSSASV